MFERFGHRAVIDHIAVTVEQIGVARQPLVQGVNRRQRRLVFDDEAQLFAADAVVFVGILLHQRLALLFGEVRPGELAGDVVEPLGAADESLIELPQQLGLLRPFDRIVADETAHGIHGQAVAARQKKRNTFAVVNYIVKRKRPGHALQLETVITLLVEHGRVDDRLRQGRHLLQVNIFGVVADDAARNLHLRRLAGTQHDGRGQGDEKRLCVH